MLGRPLGIIKDYPPDPWAVGKLLVIYNGKVYAVRDEEKMGVDPTIRYHETVYRNISSGQIDVALKDVLELIDNDIYRNGPIILSNNDINATNFVISLEDAATNYNAKYIEISKFSDGDLYLYSRDYPGSDIVENLIDIKMVKAIKIQMA